MATIPIFDATRTSNGSIAPATAGVFTSTANLLLNEGRALSERIEAQSAKTEAQAKAPIIATSYADGLAKIAQGDLSGFGVMESASAMAAGNPFLMKFAEGARQEAIQISRNFLDTELSKRRIEAQKQMNDADNLVRKDLAETGVNKSRESSYLIADRQWLKEQADLDAKDSASEEADKQFRIDRPEEAANNPPFKKSQRRPRPTPQEFGLSGKSATPFDETGIPLPQESGSDYTNQLNITPGVPQPATDIPAEERNYSTQEDLANIQNKEAQGRQQLEKNFTKVSLGSTVNVWLPNIEQDEESSTSTYKIGNVTKRFTDKGKNKTEIKMIQEMSSDIRAVKGLPEDFQNWAGKMMELNYKVKVEKDGTASASNGQETQYFTDGQTVKAADGKGTEDVPAWDARGKRLTIPEKDVEVWNKAKGAMNLLAENKRIIVEGVGKGVVSTPAERTQLRNIALAKFIAKGVTPEQKQKINQTLGSQGIPAIKEEEAGKDIIVNEKGVKEAEVLKDAGLDPNQKDIIDKAADVVKSVVKSISGLGDKSQIATMKTTLKEYENLLKSPDIKDNPYSAKLYAAQIVKLRSEIEKKEKSL